MTKNTLRTLLLGCLFLFLLLLALETAYRAFLYGKFPDHFSFRTSDENMELYDKPQWQYDSRFGYSYPHVSIATTIIRNGLVTQCLKDTFTNVQGDVGVTVLDFNKAKNRILIFGDSFTAQTVEGQTWPNLLSVNLNRHSRSNNAVRVRSLARDGYGILQMFDLAAVKIPELKPTLVVFAFNSTAITRDRGWRVKVGEGNDARMLATIENSSTPHLKNSTDMEILMPAASKKWCTAMLSKTAEEQRKDPLLKIAINKSLLIRQENGTLLKANIWDLHSSYTYNLLFKKDPFFGQWKHKPSAANPMITYENFRNDPQFLKALAAVQAQGVPYILMHLPMGISIRDHQEFYLDPQGQALKNSLEEITNHKVVSMRPYLTIKDSEGMKLCRAPDNCHPSIFGMQSYADSMARILSPLLKQDNV